MLSQTKAEPTAAQRVGERWASAEFPLRDHVFTKLDSLSDMAATCNACSGWKADLEEEWSQMTSAAKFLTASSTPASLSLSCGRFNAPLRTDDLPDAILALSKLTSLHSASPVFRFGSLTLNSCTDQLLRPRQNVLDAVRAFQILRFVLHERDLRLFAPEPRFKNLKGLCIQVARDTSWQKSTKRQLLSIMQQLSSLEELQLSGIVGSDGIDYPVPGTLVDAVAPLPYLTKLVLKNLKLTMSCWTRLETLTLVRDLSLDEVSLPYPNGRRRAAMRRWFIEAGDRFPDMFSLDSMPRLCRLKITHGQLAQVYPSHWVQDRLINLTYLEALELDSVDTIVFRSSVIHFQWLTSLVLAMNKKLENPRAEMARGFPPDTRHPANFRLLEHLSLTCRSSHMGFWIPMMGPEFPSLKSLSICSTSNILPADLSCLAAISGLTRLHVERATCAVLQTLTGLGDLQSLSLPCNVQGDLMASGSGIVRLTEELASLIAAGFPNLVELDVSNRVVEPGALLPLRALLRLRTVFVGRRGVLAEGSRGELPHRIRIRKLSWDSDEEWGVSEH